jgi:hypothetical protein
MFWSGSRGLLLVCLRGFVCYKLQIGVVKNGHDQSVGP